MNQNNTGFTPETLRLLGAALALQQTTSTAANLIPIPNTGRFIAIGTPAEVARLLEIAPAAPATPLLNGDELAALRRFDECAQDGEGYDVQPEMMAHLAEIGVVRRLVGGYFKSTEFGMRVLEGGAA